MDKEKVQEHAAKVLHHVRKARVFQASAEALEKWALDEAERQTALTFQRKRWWKPWTWDKPLIGRPTPVEYRAKILLQDHFWYKVATGNRDAHEAQAKLAAVAMAAEKELG